MRIGIAASRIMRNLGDTIDVDVPLGACALALLLALSGAAKTAVSHAINGIEYRKQRSAARAEISDLKTMLEQYRTDYGAYPTTDQGLGALMNSRQIDPGMIIPPEPAARAPRDPWGHPFFYDSDGDSYLLKSLGPTGHGNDPDLTIAAPPGVR